MEFSTNVRGSLSVSCGVILCSLCQGGDGESEELWGEVDAIVVVVGKDDVLYSKSTTLQVPPHTHSLSLMYWPAFFSLYCSSSATGTITACGRKVSE